MKPGWVVCEQKDRHLPHEWFTERDEFRRCPGVFDRPTLDAACERIAAYLHAAVEYDGRTPNDLINGMLLRGQKVALLKSDLVALLAAVGWGVTAEEARIAEPAPEQETLL